MRQARLGPGAAQRALGQGAGANIAEGTGPIDTFFIWAATSPKPHTPPYAPREYCRRQERQHVKNFAGRVIQIAEDFA